MRILIALACPYFPSSGGAIKVTRTIAETLAGRGHIVRVVALARVGVRHGASLEEFLAYLQRCAIDARRDGDIVSFTVDGVEVCAVDGALRIPDAITAQIRELDPTWVFTQTEDWRGMCLDAALTAAPARVVYFAHTTVLLPFGPDSADPRDASAQLVRRVRHIIAPSRFMAEYLKTWGAVDARVVYPPGEVFGVGPHPHARRADAGAILMVNPGVLKGLTIFLELARRRPELPFAAVPSWNTTDEDIRTLEALPNVSILPPSFRPDDFYAAARVLLAPSLWTEVFGLIAIEAMLRGIPVLASASGGLPEAMLGMDFVLPVRCITRCKLRNAVPVPAGEVPEQDLEPWLRALDIVLEPAEYDRRSADVRAAATRWVGQHGIERLEAVLAEP